MRSALRRLPAPSSVVAALASAVALYSAWHSGGHVWRQLNSEYRTYAAYTPTERRHSAPVVCLPGGGCGPGEDYGDQRQQRYGCQRDAEANRGGQEADRGRAEEEAGVAEG